MHIQVDAMNTFVKYHLDIYFISGDIKQLWIFLTFLDAL